MITFSPRVVILAFAAGIGSTSLAAQFEIARVVGLGANERMGAAVGSVVDSNGTSLVLFGAPGNGSNGSRGTVTVRTLSAGGSLTWPSSSFVFPLSGSQAGDQFGASIRRAGRNEFLVGAPGRTGGAGEGQLIDATTGGKLSVFSGLVAGDRAGHSIASVGDIDGDNAPDYLLGAPNTLSFICWSTNNRGQLGSGLAYDRTGTALFARIDGSIRCCTPFCAVGDNLGHAVCELGDVTGSGTPEFLVGHWKSGLVYVCQGTPTSITVLRSDPFSGGISDLGVSLAVMGDCDGDGVVDYAAGAPGARQVQLISGARGTVIFTWIGNQPDFGRSIANVGDQNGGGLADIAIGAPQANSGDGAVYVFATEGNRDLLGIMLGNGGEALGTSISGVDDWTGDNRPEVVIGAPNHNEPGLVNAGRAYVFTLDCNVNDVNCFGQGCLGPSGLKPQLGTPAGHPMQGGSAFQLSVCRVSPGSRGFLILGAAQLNPPFNLGFLLPGCFIHVAPIAPFFAFPTTTPTTLATAGYGFAVTPPISVPMTVPAGTPLFAQWLIPDPGPAIFPAALSDAVELRVR